MGYDVDQDEAVSAVIGAAMTLMEHVGSQVHGPIYAMKVRNLQAAIGRYRSEGWPDPREET